MDPYGGHCPDPTPDPTPDLTPDLTSDPNPGSSLRAPAPAPADALTLTLTHRDRYEVLELSQNMMSHFPSPIPDTTTNPTLLQPQHWLSITLAIHTPG